MCVEGVWDPNRFSKILIKRALVSPTYKEVKMATKIWSGAGKKWKDALSYIGRHAVAFLVVLAVITAALFVSVLMNSNAKALASNKGVDPPKAVEPAPAVAAAEPVAPAVVEKPAEVARPKAVEPAVSLPVIMTVTQVGGGEFIKGWEVKPTGWPQVTTGTVTLPMEDKRDWDGIIKENGKPVFIVIISSDAGNANAKKVNYASPDKGFVAGFITTDSESISITTGWNDQNEHYNVWMEKFIVPTDEVLDDVLKEKLAEKQATEKKPVAFAILSNGEIFKLK